MPLGESMISVLKSNKNLKLIKENRFKSLAKWRKPKKTKYNFPEATPQVLREIRERLKKERKLRLIKQLVIFITIIGVFLFLFL